MVHLCANVIFLFQDLNPILWANLEHHLRKHTKPTNKEELVQGIKDFWKTVTPAMCKRNVDHVRKVVPAVVASDGGPMLVINFKLLDSILILLYITTGSEFKSSQCTL